MFCLFRPNESHYALRNESDHFNATSVITRPNNGLAGIWHKYRNNRRTCTRSNQPASERWAHYRWKSQSALIAIAANDRYYLKWEKHARRSSNWCRAPNCFLWIVIESQYHQKVSWKLRRRRRTKPHRKRKFEIDNGIDAGRKICMERNGASTKPKWLLLFISPSRETVLLCKISCFFFLLLLCCGCCVAFRYFNLRHFGVVEKKKKKKRLFSFHSVASIVLTYNYVLKRKNTECPYIFVTAAAAASAASPHHHYTQSHTGIFEFLLIFFGCVVVLR